MCAERAKASIKRLISPLSEDVSLSQSRRFPATKAEKLARHIEGQIAGGEFCADEGSFLSAFVQISEEYEPADTPAHRRHLAEALLIGKLKDSWKKSIYGKASALTRNGFRIRANLRARGVFA